MISLQVYCDAQWLLLAQAKAQLLFKSKAIVSTSNCDNDKICLHITIDTKFGFSKHKGYFDAFLGWLTKQYFSNEQSPYRYVMLDMCGSTTLIMDSSDKRAKKGTLIPGVYEEAKVPKETLDSIRRLRQHGALLGELCKQFKEDEIVEALGISAIASDLGVE